jgi:thiamine-monophosphate kinase
VGAKIRLSALPLSSQYRKHCLELSNDFYYPALCGGEDYELLFTVNPQNRKKVENLAKRLTTSLTCIGEITGNPSELAVLDEKGQRVPCKEEGYKHF